MTTHHDPLLVVLSIVIAVLASYTALDLTNSLFLVRGRVQMLWLAIGSLAMGAGIWSMHFTGMLAFRLSGHPISYELRLLVASILIAVLASWLALYIFTRPQLSRVALVASGLAMGVAISGMHYTGMAALRADATIEWSGPLVVASILVAVAASFVALNLAARMRTDAGRHAGMMSAGSALMGVAIAGMHYTAMAAAQFHSASLVTGDETRLLATRGLAIAVTLSSILILVVAIGASVTTRGIARRSAAFRREQEFAARIRESEEYYRALIEHASDLIVVTDAEGNRRYVSPSYERVLGYKGDELIGRSAWEFVHPEDRNAAHQAIEVLRSRPGDEVELALRVMHASGDWRTLRAIIQNLIEHPAVRGFIITAQDETERRRLEMQFQQSQKMEAVGKLAGGVAHDFNNLLTVIIGNVSMLLDDDDTSEDVEALREIHDAARRATALTRQLLAFSRRQVLQPQIVQINESARGIFKMISRLLAEDIVVQLRLADSLPSVRADRGQVEQAILNLAVNARDAMPQGGLMTISTFHVTLNQALISVQDEVPAGEYVVLEVADSGCGIEPMVVPRIFEPFFTTKEVGKGTGLGLATVYGIMKQSGGYVTVDSALERGAKFRLYFPALDVAPEQPSESAVVDPSSDATAATILLIEDEAAVRSLAKRALEQRGYQVIDAGSGAEAVLRANGHRGPIHLILSDVVLPDLNGREVTDRITLTRPGARVLFMSGYTEDEIIHRGVMSKGLNYLQKPFAPAELVAKVKLALEN